MDNRIAVPALPMSRGWSAPCRPCGPTPCTITCWSAGRSMRTPSACRARSVAWQSPPARNSVMSVTTRAIPPNIKARWEIDLSPGTVSSPAALPPGPARYFTMSHHRAGVGAENTEQRGALLQLFQRLRHVRIVSVALYVDEEDIIPLLAVRGARLDPSHAHPMVRQRLQ